KGKSLFYILLTIIILLLIGSTIYFYQSNPEFKQTAIRYFPILKKWSAYREKTNPVISKKTTSEGTQISSSANNSSSLPTDSTPVEKEKASYFNPQDSISFVVVYRKYTS